MRRRFSRGTAGPSWPTSARCNSASRLPSTTCPQRHAANWEAPNDGPGRGLQHHPAIAGGPAAVAHTRAHRGRSGDRGTPQGSAISPVLANLFMHYASDTWLAREFPLVRFERYADDAVIHCVSEHQARKVLAALHERMTGVGLELHPGKTRIVYCKDSNRRG